MIFKAKMNISQKNSISKSDFQLTTTDINFGQADIILLVPSNSILQFRKLDH